MQPQVSEHVEMLNAMQPFDAGFSQIYFESSSATIRLQTRAAEALRSHIGDPEVRLVVLTGDAGHGKTYMCADLLMSALGYDIDHARIVLNDKGYGDAPVGVLPDGRELYVVKDLSELPTTKTPVVLATALAANDRFTVVCANEGRLRSAITDRPDLAGLLELLDDSIRVGSTTADRLPAVILNLNHQSVVAVHRQTTGLLDQVLAQWVLEDEPWQTCTKCSLSSGCPVYRNRSELAASDDAGTSARTVLSELLRVVERTGHTVTVRELLILVSHLITGGLRCGAVKDAAENSDIGWQWRYLYHQVCFGSRVPPEVAEGLSAFRGLRVLDPGDRALRSVDDRLDVPMERGPFDPPVPDVLTKAANTSARAAEQSRVHAALWRDLRRRDVFRAHVEGSPATTYERLGLRHAADFDAVVEGSAGPSVKHAFMAGLAAVQGLASVSRISLKLVDPAFTTGSAVQRTARGSGAGAVVVAGSLTSAKIVLASQSEAWKQRNSGAVPGVVDEIDWSERQIVVSFDGPSFELTRAVTFDLAAFEFILSFGEGLRAWRFYEPDVRRVLRRLAVIAETNTVDDGIVELASSNGDFKLLVDGTSLVGGS